MPDIYFDFGASVAKATYEGNVTVPTPAGATVITQAAYNTKSASIKAASAAAGDAARTAQTQNAADDYAALVSAGIPVATAKRLTGHQGA